MKLYMINREDYLPNNDVSQIYNSKIWKETRDKDKIYDVCKRKESMMKIPEYILCELMPSEGASRTILDITPYKQYAYLVHYSMQANVVLEFAPLKSKKEDLDKPLPTSRTLFDGYNTFVLYSFIDKRKTTRFYICERYKNHLIGIKRISKTKAVELYRSCMFNFRDFIINAIK